MDDVVAVQNDTHCNLQAIAHLTILIYPSGLGSAAFKRSVFVRSAAMILADYVQIKIQALLGSFVGVCLSSMPFGVAPQYSS